MVLYFIAETISYLSYYYLRSGIFMNLIASLVSIS